MTPLERSQTFDTLVSRWILRLRREAPFFATLVLFTHFYPSRDVPTAATDGENLYFNLEFMEKLPINEQLGVVIHEVLHAALLHVPRRQNRDPKLWNWAADIVVNAQVLEAKFALPRGHIRVQALEKLTVEEVYEKLLEQSPPPSYSPDLLEDPPEDAPPEVLAEAQRPRTGSLSEAYRRELERHWKDAVEKALTVQRMSGQGNLPSGLERLISGVVAPQLDWKSALWRYLVRTPSDFQGFDRRFIGRGLYLEGLEGQSVRVYACIDTSGSVGQRELGAFMAELRGILGAYPLLECRLYFADTALYGPYSLSDGESLPAPKGGGGTDFRPFFEALESDLSPLEEAVCVYLTDGFGQFPEQVPEHPTLWVVPAGGERSSEFPFGEVVMLLEHG